MSTDVARPRTRISFALATLVIAGVGLAACGGGKSSGTTSGGQGTGGSGSGGDPCTAACEVEVSLMCPKTSAAGCTAACQGTTAAVSWCAATVSAATACLAKEPAASFACDMTGNAAPKSGVCTAELAAIPSCWNNGPPGGLPDLTQACSAACAAEAGLSCADPSCQSHCTDAVMPGKKCNGAFAALVACAAKQPATSFGCSMASPPAPILNQGFCSFETALLVGCLQQP